MRRVVIVAYRPRASREDALLAAVRKHLDVLRAERLATDRPATVLRAAGGTVVEVFEWASADAVARAHTNAAVHTLWAEFAAAGDYVPLADLPEARQRFAEFGPLDL